MPEAEKAISLTLAQTVALAHALRCFAEQRAVVEREQRRCEAIESDCRELLAEVAPGGALEPDRVSVDVRARRLISAEAA